MGTGELNAKRALQQFSPGEFHADGADVPLIGWDYGHTTGEDDNSIYAFSQPLLGGSFVSITLAWDRHVEFASDSAPTNVYNSADSFQPSESPAFFPENDDQINDLDIYLLPKGAFTIGEAIALSDSIVGTVEHLFFQVPTTGEYEFWINQFDADIPGGQNYAVAWWAATAPTAASLGDYNGDSIVNAADYDVWKSNFGTSFAAADGNGDGTVNAADYTVWRNNLGQSAGSGSAATSPSPVPEPWSLVLLSRGLALVGQYRDRGPVGPRGGSYSGALGSRRRCGRSARVGSGSSFSAAHSTRSASLA